MEVDTTNTKIRVAIVGASGYTGAELVRLLVCHPAAQLSAMTADRKAGRNLGNVFPHLASAERNSSLPGLVSIDAVDWDDIDVAFLGLPHGTTQSVALALPGHLKIIDLSADFRLADTAAYALWLVLKIVV